MKKCSKCGKSKMLSEFWNSKRYKDGKYCSCIECQKKTNADWEKRNPNYEKNRRLMGRNKTSSRIYSRILYSSKKRGIELKISREEFKKWHESQEKKCIYCGIHEDNLKHQGDSQLNRFGESLSIDRKDSLRAYEHENLVLSCHRCNLTKSDFFTYEEMIEIGQKYIKPKRNKSC